MALGAESPETRVTYARVDYLFRIGIVVVGVAVVAATIVRGLAGIFGVIPPAFAPLSWSQVTGVSVVGSAGGVFTYALLDRYTAHPRRNFMAVAAVILLLSTAPLWVAGRMEGATVQSIFVLALLHLVVAVVTVGLLVRMDRGTGRVNPATASDS
ncbi:DUF6069 family protein [Haladaptatus sp. DJG-WS-42]|uniref:DUF6069 family protein n=1 Tax=Haladaptatus sp. DJG-WS-42 TaxID=3120516 RepID=UPI0030D5F297